MSGPATSWSSPGCRGWPAQCEGTLEGLEAAQARGRTGGRKPKLTARQVTVARHMYDEKGPDGKRRYTVAEIAETFHVSGKTIYRHLEPSPAATSSQAG